MNRWFAVVDRLADKAQRHAAALELCDGDLSARANRGRLLAADKVDALLYGLVHPDPVVRRECLQILDQHPSPRAVPLIMDCLGDSVARVRWHAVHALSCDVCKAGTALADDAAWARIAQLAACDPSARVRRQAQLALTERGVTT